MVESYTGAWNCSVCNVDRSGAGLGLDFCFLFKSALMLHECVELFQGEVCYFSLALRADILL